MNARANRRDIHRHDYIGPYVADLANVVDMDAICASGVTIGIDPLGGAGDPLLAADRRTIRSRGDDRERRRSIRPFAS